MLHIIFADIFFEGLVQDSPQIIYVIVYFIEYFCTYYCCRQWIVYLVWRNFMQQIIDLEL